MSVYCEGCHLTPTYKAHLLGYGLRGYELSEHFLLCVLFVLPVL